MKLVLWLVIIAAVVMWLLRAKKALHRSGAAHAEPSADKATGRAAEAMLQCAHCGVHFPASDAVGSLAGPVFCSEQHRLQHTSR
jgi:uncharacterized protein